MKDSERVTHWIEAILGELSTNRDDQGSQLLEACGRECARRSNLLDGAVRTRKEAADKEDRDALFAAFKAQYFDTPDFSKEGNTVMLIFRDCTCPLVKAGVRKPSLCHCTVGYSKSVFEALFGGTVEVTLEQSILNGDPACRQTIRIGD